MLSTKKISNYKKKTFGELRAPPPWHIGLKVCGGGEEQVATVSNLKPSYLELLRAGF